MRTKLTQSLSASEFKSLYFTVKELRVFCRRLAIITTSEDRKKDLTQRVFKYLNSGQLGTKISSTNKADVINKLKRLLNDTQK
ncbi:MAG: hypothetical protein O2897_01390 [bacterium]|nr:hypothetical protein [bacterium]